MKNQIWIWNNDPSTSLNVTSCLENGSVVDTLDVTRNLGVSLDCACSAEKVYSPNLVVHKSWYLYTFDHWEGFWKVIHWNAAWWYKQQTLAQIVLQATLHTSFEICHPILLFGTILLLNLCDLPPYTPIWHYTFIRYTRVFNRFLHGESILEEWSQVWGIELHKLSWDQTDDSMKIWENVIESRLRGALCQVMYHRRFCFEGFSGVVPRGAKRPSLVTSIWKTAIMRFEFSSAMWN